MLKNKDGRVTFFHFSILLIPAVWFLASSSMDLQLDWPSLVAFIIAASVLLFFFLRKYRGVVEETVSDAALESEW